MVKGGMSYTGNLRFENPRIKYYNIVMQMNRSKKKKKLQTFGSFSPMF